MQTDLEHSEAAAASLVAARTQGSFPLHWPPQRNRGTPATPKRRLSRSCIPQRLGRRLTTAQFFWRTANLFG